MSSPKLIRWSGVAAMLGGVLWMVMFLFRPMFIQDPNRTVLGLTGADLFGTIIVPVVFLTVGLLGVHVRHAGRSGKLGTTGFIVAFIGFTLMLVGTVGGFERGRPLEIFWLGGDILLPVGLVLFGIATVKAKVLPPWSRGLPLARL